MRIEYHSLVPAIASIGTLDAALSTKIRFGQLFAMGLDLDRLISQETSIQDLREALRRLRSDGDMRNILRVARRVAEIDLSQNSQAELFRSLVWAQHYDEALTLFTRIRDGSGIETIGPEACARLLMRIAEGNADVQLARHVLNDAALTEVVRTELLRSLFGIYLARSDVSSARRTLTDIIARSAYDAETAVLDVRCRFSESGPKVALDYLDTLGHMLSRDGAQYRIVWAWLMNERGRFNEVLDQSLAWLDETDVVLPLLPHAQNAAQQSDRIEEFDRFLRGIHAKYPDQPQIEEMLCSIAIEQDDAVQVATLLPRIQQRSSWSYLTLLFSRACQQPVGHEIDALLHILRNDGVLSTGTPIMYALHKYYYATDVAGLNQALELIAPLAEKAGADSNLNALHLRLLIALDQDLKAEEVFNRLAPGICKSAAIEPFSLYFLARRSSHEAARSGWRSFLADSAHMALEARSAYPEQIVLRHVPKDKEILVFVTIFNGIEYISWFLDYYRRIGVDHFFFIDNGSTDGTFELLLGEPDVSCFRQTGSFAASGCGVSWVNHLMRRHGVGKWCLHLDMDEALVFPGMKSGRQLSDLVSYFDAHGYGTAAGLMIDIYPSILSASEAEDPFVASNLIDSDYMWMRNEIPPYFFVKGGVRARITGRSLMMTKAPLVKMAEDTAYLATNHQLTHRPVADVTIGLLHYKFIGNVRYRVSEAVERKQHFSGARFYRVLQDSFFENSYAKDLMGASSEVYRDSDQLVDLGLMRSSPKWDGWMRD